MNSITADLRYALRQLLKSPVFAFTAILTLGLGIGVNAAMFSVIEQVMLHPLPYANADRIVAIGTTPQGQTQMGPVSFPDLRDYQARSHSIERLGSWSLQLPTLGGTENPETVPQIMTTTNMLPLLGVQPMLGRAFTPEDGQPGHTNVVLLSAGVWTKFFHGDRSIVGRTIPINGDPYTVIGVLPAAFEFPMDIGEEEMLSPLDLSDKALEDRGSAGLQPVALLRPGVSVAQVSAELNSIHRQLRQQYPNDETGDTMRVVNYRDQITEDTRPALFALDWAVIAVWLIACANVAGLMLTRTNARRREIAIRGALGADRSRIVRQFLTESLLLSVAGGLAGLGIAAVALRLLSKYLEHAVLYGKDIHINGAVFAFLLAASIVTALIFGLAPAWSASRMPAQDGLKEGSAAAGTSRRQAMWRDGLVVGEITLTLALLIAAGLMLQTLLALRHTDLGFTTENVVTGTIYMPTHGAWWNLTADPKTAPNTVQLFYAPLMEKLEHTPGVEAAGLSNVRPLTPNWNWQAGIVINGRPKPKKGDEPNAQVRGISPGYFKAMGIRLMRGRLFGEDDGAGSPLVAVVNRTFVKRIFPHEDPLGKQVNVADKGPRQWATIVGVVEDTHQRYAGEAPLPEFDMDLNQLTPSDDLYPVLTSLRMDVAVRSRLPLATIDDAIRRDVHGLRPEIAVQDLQPMQQIVDDSLGNQTLAARLLGIFAIAALTIAVAGIYGLLAFSVSQRTRELGVRIALGADRQNVLWLVLRHALVLLAAGIALGLCLAWAAVGVMRSFLTGLHGADALTVLCVALLLGVCGLAASYIPARRAAGIDPIEALRTE